jgi:mycofactocin precursor
MMKITREQSITINNEIKTIEEEPQVLEEIAIEELGIDGICGVY